MTKEESETLTTSALEETEEQATETRVSAEWEKQQAVWVGNVRLESEWDIPLHLVSQELDALAKELSERVRVYRPLELGFPFGDCWLRDTAPIFSKKKRSEKKDQLIAHRFLFNGWGGKYEMPGDLEVGEKIARFMSATICEHPWVFEGGALEVDGEGTALLIESTLVGAGRQKGSAQQVADCICSVLGLERAIVLRGQLRNDHTDGHIDTLVRFVRPGEVVCAQGSSDDPNYEALEELAEQCATSVDARGRRLKVRRIPSPGAILGPDGELLATSYCNYVQSNKQIIVPRFGSPQDDVAANSLAEFFPAHTMKSLSSKAIATGGGSFHCVTTNIPA